MNLVRRNTVGDALRRTARLQRDATALIFGERSWSFNALDRAADRVARRFADKGLRAGDPIAAYGRNADGCFIDHADRSTKIIKKLHNRRANSTCSARNQGRLTA